MEISESLNYWPELRKQSTTEHNFTLKLLGASLAFNDRLSREQCKEILGFKKFEVFVERDSAELKLIKRVQKATKYTYFIRNILSVHLTDELLSLYRKDKSLCLADAKRLYCQILDDLNIEPLQSPGDRMNWYSVLTYLGDIIVERLNNRKLEGH